MGMASGGVLRCGTLKHSAYKPEHEISTPRLVERCRKLEAMAGVFNWRKDWERLGIASSINLPSNRPLA